MKDKFRRKDGLCTTYALGCGHLNAAEHGGDRMAVTMGAEGAVYFVKSRVHRNTHGLGLWATFERNAEGYRAAIRLFRNLRASLRYIGVPIGYRATNPKLDLYNRFGYYVGSTNWYRAPAHVWAYDPVNNYDREPFYSRVVRA